MLFFILVSVLFFRFVLLGFLGLVDFNELRGL